MRHFAHLGMGMFALLLLTVASCSNAGDQVGLCDLFDASAAFDQKTVTVSANIESDGIERTVLVDPSCPRKAIALSIPDKASHLKGAEALLDAIYRHGTVGTRDKRITATVTGRYMYRQEQVPSRVLTLERAADVRIARKGDQ